MNINALSITKFVAAGIVGIGTGKIVGKIIKDHVKPETLIDKVTVTAAAWVISAVVTKATKQYTEETIDEVVEMVTTGVGKIKLNTKLNNISDGHTTFEKEGLDPSQFRKNEKGRWAPIGDEEKESLEIVTNPKKTDN
jgi:hypothetical protein